MGSRLRDGDRGDEGGESHEEEGDDVSDGGGDGGVHVGIVSGRGAEVKYAERNLVIVLRALRVDPADFHLRDAEGTESAADVVVVEDVGVCHEIGLPVTQGLDFCSRTVGLDDGGVAGAETASAGTVILQVLDAHPPGV